ncbi:hypothetical protein [Achromobacter anxifer]
MKTETTAKRQGAMRRFVKKMARLAQTFLAACAMMASAGAWAAEPTLTNALVSDLTYGYSNCFFSSTPPDLMYFATINFKDVRGHLGSKFPALSSRGYVVYNYDKEGRLLPYLTPSLMSTDLDLEGPDMVTRSETSTMTLFSRRQDQDAKYIKPLRPHNAWRIESAFSPQVRIRIWPPFIDPLPIANWVAIGIRAANLSSPGEDSRGAYPFGGEVVLDSKTAYIRRHGGATTCEMISDPENPPPMEARIDMNVPDWNLGELTPGEMAEKSFSDAAAQLCFTYDGPKLAGYSYIINATNQNGLSGDGRYQLRHQAAPSDTVPYRLALRNAATNNQVELPGTRNVSSTLARIGRECFSPTFTAEPPKGTKEGDYSDVLTFTVVVRP